ncbi:MAG: GDP-mannose 4,6-dehydratase [Armatimonadota bacterium]
MKRILVTGGAGFIGSNFVRYMLDKYKDYQIFVLDALTYAGNRENIPETIWNDRRFFFIHGNICDRKLVNELVSQVDQVVHMAAETHVDNSIYNTDDFVDTDVKGTQILLDAVRKNSTERFIHISTSEVYGTAMKEPMDENQPLNPRSPYAAAKAAADRLAYSYYCTFDLPVVILRPFNNYGPYQHVEKLIPCFITRTIQHKWLPLHGNGKSTRDWLYVGDTCKAIDKALHGNLDKLKGEVINVGTGKATSIIDITKKIIKYFDKSSSLIKHLNDRPGQVEKHLSSTKKAKDLLSWQDETPFDKGLKKTIQWYEKNELWWLNLKLKHPELNNHDEN